MTTIALPNVTNPSAPTPRRVVATGRVRRRTVVIEQATYPPLPTSPAARRRALAVRGW